MSVQKHTTRLGSTAASNEAHDRIMQRTVNQCDYRRTIDDVLIVRHFQIVVGVRHDGSMMLALLCGCPQDRQ